MGIRFHCPACDRALNVKEELAGKRGICPYCRGKIEIPMASHDRKAAMPPAQAGPSGSADAHSRSTGAYAAAAPGSAGTTAGDAAAFASSHALSTPVAGSTPAAGSASNASAAATPAAAVQSGPPHGAASTARPTSAADAPASTLTSEAPPTGTATAGAAIAGTATSGTAAGGTAVAGQMADPIAAAPQLRWYVLPPGSTSQYGPASGTELLAWIQQGRVPPDSYVWREDWTEWKVAGHVLPQLGAMGATLPAAVQPGAALPMVPGQPVAAVGSLPVATSPQAVPAGLPAQAGTMPLAQGVLPAPQAVPAGAQEISVAMHAGSVAAQTVPVVPQNSPGFQAVAMAPMAAAVPAGTVLAGAGGGAAPAGSAIPTVSTTSRFAASHLSYRRRSKQASLLAVIVLVLAIAALTPFVIKVVLNP